MPVVNAELQKGPVQFQVCIRGASQKLRSEMAFRALEKLKKILPYWCVEGGGLELPARICLLLEI